VLAAVLTLAGELQVQVVAVVALVELAQLVAEDGVVLGVGRVQVHDVAQAIAALERAEHAHDRRDAAAGGDEQQLLGDLVGEHERALDPTETYERPGLGVAVEERRDLAVPDQLGGDRDAPVRAPGVRRQRVRAPMVDPVDDHPDPQVLTGLVPRPLPPGLDRDRHRVVGLALDALDAAAQLRRVPERVDQLQIVVGQERREQRAQSAQRSPLYRRNLRCGASFSHA